MKRADALAVAALWALAAWFFWPLVSGAGSLYFRDTLSHYIPQMWLTLASWREGGPPIWEPLLGLGYPLASDPHAMALYPPLALVAWLPFPLSYNLLVVLHVPLGASFMYLLARRWGCACGGALLAGVAFMFNGYAVSTVALNTLLKGLTWAPLAVLCFDAWLDGGGARWIAGAALALAIEGSGTDPQYVAFAGALVALSAVMRPRPTARSWGAIACGVAAAGALAGAALAHQYLPLATLIGQSDRAAGLGAGEIGLFPVEPKWLVSMLVPTAFPDPADPRFLLSFPRAYQPFYPDLYFGVTLCALALAGACTRTGAVALAVAAGGLVLALGEAGYVFPLLGKLVPPLRAFRFASKYFLFVGFALPLAAGRGLTAVGEGGRAAWRALVAGLGAGAAALAAASAWLSVAPLERAAAWLEANRPAEVQEELGALAGRASAHLRDALAVALIAGALALLARRRPAVAAAALGLLAVADLVHGTRASVAVAPASAIAAPPPAAALLERVPGQIAPRYATYFAAHLNYRRDRTAAAFYREGRDLMRYLSGGAYGLDPVFASSSVRLAWEAPLIDMMGAAAPGEAARALANLGVTHFVALGRAGLGAPVGQAGAVVVERLADPAPRAYVAPRAHASAASRATTAAVLALRDDAEFEGPPGTTLAPRAVKTCALRAYGRTSMEIEVDLEGEGLLVVLDSWYPGWVARVDGAERPIVRVAGLVRGIRVRGGDRRVVLSFEPRDVRLGRQITIAALGVLLVILFLGKRKTA